MNKVEHIKWIANQTKPIKLKIIILSLLSLVSSLTAIFFAYFSKEAIDTAILKDMDLFLIYAIILSLLLITQIFASILSPFLKTYYTGKTDLSLKNALFYQLLRGNILETSKHHSGSLMNYLYSDIKVVAEGIYDILPRFIYYISRFLGAFILLFFLDDVLALLLLVAGIILLILSRFISKEIKRRHHKLQEEESKVRQMMQESLENVEVIKSFEVEEKTKDHLLKKQDSHFIALMRKTMLTVFAQGGMTFFFALGYGAAIIFGALRLSEGIITFGALTAIIQLVSHIQSPFSGLSQLIPKYYSMIASIERLYQFSQFDQEYKDKKIPTSFDEIVFDQLSFSYGNKVVINNLSATIRRGSIVLIKGQSGQGKSTLLKLLLGLFEPSNGHITIKDGNNTYPLDASTRHLFTYVPQGHYILSGTIKENLSFYQDLPMDEVILKSKISLIYDDINNLKEGFDTLLGEKGYGLSIGQVQRLAIARSLLRDAPICLFDEISSALDKENEEKILSNIKKMTDKTIFIISHRDIDPKFYDIEITI